MEYIKELLSGIYKPEEVTLLLGGIDKLWNKYQFLAEAEDKVLTQKDVVLITYGDQVYQEGEDKLVTLNRFLNRYLSRQVSIVHILPFYPYTSDDGFSVTDYYSVNPELGNWQEVEKMSHDFRLLFDAVINHNSSQSDWFVGFLNGEEQYRDFYIEVDNLDGCENVTRPRTSPLVHAFTGKERDYQVWTTFSRDQVDLNFANPQLLLEVINLLLFYVSKGASIIRLDAVGFIWKEKNTTCMHLPQAHKLVKLMRSVIEHLNPSVMMLTETNVPHPDNIAYFGAGDEAHMVYNFTLPPLLAFSLLNETTERFSDWVSNLVVPHKNVCYFNFLSSHDGIGVMPVDDILNRDELNVLIDAAQANGGKVSYKSKGNGEQVPYEINCNFLSLLHGPDKDEELGVKRSLLAHAVLLTMPGLPAIYFHSMVGSVNDVKGMEESGQNRRINRQKFDYKYLEELLDNPDTRQSVILNGLKRLIDIRKNETAFDPYGEFEVISSGNGVFSLCRKGNSEEQSIYAHFNLTRQTQKVQLSGNTGWTDIITSRNFDEELQIQPLGFVWLKKRL